MASTRKTLSVPAYNEINMGGNTALIRLNDSATCTSLIYRGYAERFDLDCNTKKEPVKLLAQAYRLLNSRRPTARLKC
jgi:hypothetical protein